MSVCDFHHRHHEKKEEEEKEMEKINVSDQMVEYEFI